MTTTTTNGGGTTAATTSSSAGDLKVRLLIQTPQKRWIQIGFGTKSPLLWHPISLFALTIVCWLFSDFVLRDEFVLRICGCVIDDRVSSAVLSVVTLVVMVVDDAAMNVSVSVSIGVAVVHTVGEAEELCSCLDDENDVVEVAIEYSIKIRLELKRKNN
ncbi:hypothetical protein OSB04_004827 [Centaurea solstitialis]|uniref:PRA1 family protein n=1 Tax=Centaurea solstitialis TaxID=347529 RepID=A0AA38WG85_9ASTR|nr:hypothetical protein OSB04_004827 [Centaurea solstitialis]